MLTLSHRQQLIIGVILLAMIMVTRGQHFASLHHLPGASWAAFFLAGVYLRPAWCLPGLWTITWLMDFSSYALGTGSGFCLTPAYGFLLPAYSSLWLAGRWYASQHRFEWQTFLALIPAIIVGAAICELFSSGGFYFFSGRFTDPTIAEFCARLLRYFPAYLKSLLFYTGLACAVHTLFGVISRTHHAKTSTSQ